MPSRARWVWLLAFGVGAGIALANCSNEDEGPPPTSAPKKATRTLCKSPKKLDLSEMKATEQPGILEGTAKSSDGKSWTIRIELSDREDFQTRPGSYDLSAQESYDSCRQCVVAYSGDSLQGADRQLFQSSGTIKLDSVTSPPSAISKGSLSKVELREVKIDSASAEVTEVSGGTCYEISSFSWDTTPAPDTKCTSASDCGDPSTVTCDPKTGLCVAFQCEIETNNGCNAEHEICLAQEIGASYGACYPTCTPFTADDACPSGLECVALDADQAQGKCIKPGTAAEGSPCQPSLLDTACAPGLVCDGAEEQEVCRKTCDFFNGTVGCTLGQRCQFGGTCTDEPGDGAALEAKCGDGAIEGLPCGPDGATFRGICADVEGALTCKAPCRAGNIFKDCDEGFVCTISSGEAAIPFCQLPVAEEEVAP